MTNAMQEHRWEEKITLHDGRKVSVRAMTPQDGPALLEFYRALPEEDRLFLMEDVTKREYMDQFMQRLSSDLVFSPIAEHAGKIAGHGTLYRSAHGWTKHVGEIRVVVARDFQRHGLGSAMAKLLVKKAIDLGLDKMLAEVVENQVAAKKAFERLGFHQEAVLKGHVRDIRGKRRDLVLMTSDVAHIWQTMEALIADYSPSME